LDLPTFLGLVHLSQKKFSAINFQRGGAENRGDAGEEKYHCVSAVLSASAFLLVAVSDRKSEYCPFLDGFASRSRWGT